jgi:hypothetical protein
VTESSRLSACVRRAARCASFAPSPKSCSNSTWGLFCVGSGEVSFCQESVLR